MVNVCFGLKAGIHLGSESGRLPSMFKAGLILLSLGIPAGCSDLCRNTIVKVVKAPDGQHTAALFRRDCGSTTGFSTQLSVLTPGDKVTGDGNAFVADDNHGEAAVGAWQGSWADVRWITPDHLLIRYAAKSRIFKRTTEVPGVRITYQEVPR